MAHQANKAIPKSKKPLQPKEVTRGLLLGLFFVVAGVLILELDISSGQVAQLDVGDITLQDIIAPSTISYESLIATERARQQAAEHENPVYTRPDPSIVQKQQLLANQIFNYLDAVRVHPYLTQTEKVAYVKAVEAVSFTTAEAIAVLELPEKLWANAKREVDSILDKVLHDPVRETDLTNVRYRLGLYVSSQVQDEENNVILSIAEDLVQPNSFIDEARTEERRQAARDGVKPVIITYEENEIVIRASERIDELKIEALAAMGLHQPISSYRRYLTTLLVLTLLTGGVGYYIYKYHLNILKDESRLKVLVITSLVFVIMIRAMVPGEAILPYALPMAALTIILAGTLDQQLAMIVTIMMGLLTGYVAGNNFELATYMIFTGFIVALNVKPMSPFNALLWAGLYAIISNTAIIFLFRFIENDLGFQTASSLFKFMSMLGSGVLGGFLSASLAILGFLLVGNFTGVLTHIQLIELARPTQPLLAELLRRAPGTYHHTLVVSNLAEQAATRIGANAFLCRVGAYYHDIGKMVRPYFFTENARPGISLHENLDPETSAQIIISHVTDGLRLAKENGLPPILHAFIAEHHGTEIAGYSFYHQAVQDAGGDEAQIDTTRFRYPGPKPKSKETAILMLADASEATVRSVQPQSAEEIDGLVRKTIAMRMESGQFDECRLTLQDLEQIRIAFNEVLQGVAHQRVKYPDEVKKKVDSTASPLPVMPMNVQGHPLQVSEEGETAAG